MTGTDKNLGTAVSEHGWYNTQCDKLLSTPGDYRELAVHEVAEILSIQCEQMMTLASLATKLEGRWLGGAQLPGFFRSKITDMGARHHIPSFHGIPKIHKTPTGMRPIIPCHSAIQNPAAKFVSKLLKPIIDQASTILQSSRQFCNELSKITIANPNKVWFVSGDVVAFIPTYC